MKTSVILCTEQVWLFFNMSTFKLEMNGKTSFGKMTSHFDTKLFYFKNLVERKEVTIEYCPTDEMMADFFIQ